MGDSTCLVDQMCDLIIESIVIQQILLHKKDYKILCTWNKLMRTWRPTTSFPCMFPTYLNMGRPGIAWLGLVEMRMTFRGWLSVDDPIVNVLAIYNVKKLW